MAQLPTLFVGDTIPRLVVPITDTTTGLPLDITGCSGQLRYWIGSGAEQDRSMFVLGNPTSGQMAYQWLAPDLTRGTLVGRVKVTNGSGQVIHTSSFTQLVQDPSLPSG